MSSARILVVEDEAIIAADLEERLIAFGYDVIAVVASGEQAIRGADELKPDLVLMDIFLRGKMTGIEAAEHIRQRDAVPIIYVTSHADAATVDRATTTEPFGYILKPFNERELDAAIKVALYRHRAEAKLRKMERWLSTTLQSIGDAVIAADKDGLVTFLNPVAERLTGWRQREALGQRFTTVFRAIDGGTRQPLEDLFVKALREGFSIGLEEHICLQAKSGAETPIDDSIAPIRDDAGQVHGVVLVFRDCTERKLAEAALKQLNERLEDRVKERTAMLETANRELAAFSYSVSHDLRAPVRAVHGFARLLTDQYATVLDGEGNRFLDIITRNALQLGEMIDGFLRLFRLREEPLRIETIDMTALVNDVAAGLCAQSAPEMPEIRIAPLPPAAVDLPLIRQVWVNLLSNALKFTRDRASPVIEVGAEEQSGETVYYVKDNGVGFDPASTNRLFGVFQRLHNRAEFDGHGIGLATVALIVKRHGGRIYAEGAPNAGATFRFTLSAANANVATAEAYPQLV